VTWLRRLWHGDLPLGEAFWTWAVTGGIAVNVVTSFFFLMFMTMEQTLLAVLFGYGLSIPYNIAATVGVWRAAAREPADRGRADIYRMATLILMLLLTVT
jgi:hypothetical protein